MDRALSGGRYEIVVGAVLESGWSDWFEDFDMQPEGDTTRLSGAVVDQAALHGVLARFRDLGIPILHIHAVGSPVPDIRAQGGTRRDTPPGT